MAYIHPVDLNLPRVAAIFKTTGKSAKDEFRTDALVPFDPKNANFAQWDSIKDKFPNVEFSTYADVTSSWDQEQLSLSWKTNLGYTGTTVLAKSKASAASELDSTQRDWNDFKQYVSGLKGKRYLFRGQGKPHRLRTSFHRSGRADLLRFNQEDVQALMRHLSARTRHTFNLSNPEEFGAFLNLIQHHGYPTPLLDWTFSPFVAAFFAYRGISNETAAKSNPRVFVFDQEQWRADWQQIMLLLYPAPHFSVGEFLAIENERMIPQQAASTVTSVDDIETYIREKEAIKGKKYLWAIDLPVCDRKDVLGDLRFMGITAGSLFPGLDGACEELKDRNFDL